eukprot:539145-Rhodomonas_salina.2
MYVHVCARAHCVVTSSLHQWSRGQAVDRGCERGVFAYPSPASWCGAPLPEKGQFQAACEQNEGDGLSAADIGEVSCHGRVTWMHGGGRC